MSLPVVKTLAECADFEKTVLPYLPQLYDLPRQLLQSYNNLTELRSIYLATNPLISGLALSLFLGPVFLVVSELNKNYSQVDRCWSILPTVYNAHYVIFANMYGVPTERLHHLIAFSTIWSLRLTFNYWRRGGYSIGSEDYRWKIVQEYIGPSLFFVLNVVFIAFIQSILLFTITTPTYILLLASHYGEAINFSDMALTRVLIGLVVFEWYADGQQWKYQKAKSQYQKTAKLPEGYKQADLDRGFVVTGLWSWSRHPNFAAEQSIWVTIYFWGCVTAGVPYNWTSAGALAYLFLFQSSTWLTELITARKYPEYNKYQKTVGKFLPTWGSGFPRDVEDQTSQVSNPVAKTAKSSKAK